MIDMILCGLGFDRSGAETADLSLDGIYLASVFCDGCCLFGDIFCYFCITFFVRLYRGVELLPDQGKYLIAAFLLFLRPGSNNVIVVLNYLVVRCDRVHQVIQ